MTDKLLKLCEKMTPREQQEVESFIIFVLARRKLRKLQLLADDISTDELMQLVESSGSFNWLNSEFEDVYTISKSFPKEETYGLRSQLRRSAVSIPSNIAEGFARFHNKEYRNFLYISLGSCAELTTQIIIASRLKYVEEKKADTILSNIDVISKMTMSLIKKLNTND